MAEEPRIAVFVDYENLAIGARSLRKGTFKIDLVLTRLLFPEAFGLMAIVNTMLAGLAMFSDLGLSISVVQSRRGDGTTVQVRLPVEAAVVGSGDRAL